LSATFRGVNDASEGGAGRAQGVRIIQ
jgi:hypothetical protein